MKRSSVVLLLMCLALVPARKLGAQGTGVLLHAEYGADSDWIDVTQRVGEMLRNNYTSFRIESTTLGVDPAVGLKKVFRLVTRERNGKIQHMEFMEKQTITLRGYSFDSNSTGLRILGAECGAGNQVADVTAQVDALIRGGQITMRVTDETLGGDPAPKQAKALTVWYTFNGLAAQAVVRENDYLKMPGGNGFAGYIHDDQSGAN
jgi:hypothetical protein